jgi:cholesterol transport system auxiliary component
VVDIALKVMNDANGRVLASGDFVQRVPASSDGSDEGVAALNAALDVVLRDMAIFILDTI